MGWQALLKRYPSGLDYPLSAFYKELLVAFPDAKVILTIRDPDSWYESALETIYRRVTVPRWVGWLLPPFQGFSAMVWHGPTGGTGKTDRPLPPPPRVGDGRG